MSGLETSRERFLTLPRRFRKIEKKIKITGFSNNLS